MMGFPIRKVTNAARERVYTDMEMWTEVRRRVLNKELSKRAACKEYSIHWDTLTRILEHVEPPGYQQAEPRPKPKIGPFLPIIPLGRYPAGAAPEYIGSAVFRTFRAGPRSCHEPVT